MSDWAWEYEDYRDDVVLVVRVHTSGRLIRRAERVRGHA